jgi:hypothetical protein
MYEAMGSNPSIASRNKLIKIKNKERNFLRENYFGPRT